ncbi:MAG: aminomethyl-transferring glycine dehydrogenase subunit GcvPB [Bacillota bacterium]|nr:aminomethyl-transferring glycine dehydrogenase subunit GcvPB [Bacillota bacterium]
MKYEKMIFDLSVEGRKAYSLPELDVPAVQPDQMIPAGLLRSEGPDFPEVFELDVIRHYTNLSQKNFGIDTGFYPLGSCTMKYNPKINEQMARLDGFVNLHPRQDESTVQGALRLMYDLDQALCEITGMDKMTLNPAAGAHGEFTGINLIKAYHEHRGDFKRDKIIVPDSAHGTNPATAVMAGCSVVEVPSQADGLVDIEALKTVLGDDTCALMLTNPNTVGLFESHIQEITNLVHQAGGLVYYDGANMNAIMGHARPGDMGFDVVHLNIHKTFTTPHGGGGPGCGPVGVKKILEPFLPKPTVEKTTEGGKERYHLNFDLPQSIGRVKDFHGHFAMMVRAYTYILMMGADGLKEASTVAVLNANYIKESLRDDYRLAFPQVCKHECVFAGLNQEFSQVATIDVAKRLLDMGFHPPTVYFPLIVPEALMIEPTETESKETLDAFIDAMKTIAREARETPEVLKSAPQTTPVRRPDEALAARNPILKYIKE